jgi:hypothetical protein
MVLKSIYVAIAIMYCTPSKPKVEGYGSIPTTVKQTDQLARCEHNQSNIILNNFTTVITFPGMDLLGGGMRGRARCAPPEHWQVQGGMPISISN